MKQFLKSLLAMIALFMLSIAVFATKIPIPQDSGVSSISTSTQDITISSINSEFVDETDTDLTVAGWGNADGVDVQILTIHPNPQQNLSTYKVQNSLKNYSKEIATTITGNNISIRVAVDYWYDPNISDNTIIDSVELKLKQGYTTKDSVALSYVDDYNWQPFHVGNKRRERNFYTVIFDSTSLEDYIYTFEIVVKYKNGSTGKIKTANANAEVTSSNGNPVTYDRTMYDAAEWPWAVRKNTNCYLFVMDDKNPTGHGVDPGYLNPSYELTDDTFLFNGFTITAVQKMYEDAKKE